MATMSDALPHRDKIADRLLDFVFAHGIERLRRLWRREHSDRYVSEARAFDAATSEQIEHHQCARLRALIGAALRTDFYRPRLAAAGITSPDAFTWARWRAVEPIGKSTMREYAPRMIPSGVDINSLRRSATGGTTQSPAPYWMDFECLDRRWAATRAADERAGHVPGMKAAYLWAASQDFPKPLPGEVGVWLDLRRRLFLAVDKLDAPTLDRYLALLTEFRPHRLQGYSTPLEMLARHILDRRTTLPIPVVASTAEPLLQHQRALIRAAFGVEPIEWYTAREAGRIATECAAHQGLHVNAWGLLVETDGDRLPDGSQPILITDLWNRGMPMLRYAMGDLGRLVDEPCVCGLRSPRLVNVVGRVLDTFQTSTGLRVAGVTLPNRVLKDSTAIREMQVIQKAIRVFEIRIVPGAQYSDSATTAVKRYLDELMGEDNQVQVSLVDAIPREASGKVRFCKNEMMATDAPR
jgi:phenylacetate-CoA ligase